jgi:opacity protein-like surface antigen
LQAFGTSRLRLGYAFDRWLPYVTGGMAWGYVHGKEGDTAVNGANGSGAEFHYGWAAGGGLEARIYPHWSAMVEYLYADLRDGKAFADQFGGIFLVDQSERMKVQVVRAGLNYKFDAGPSLLPFLPPNPGPSAGPWSSGGLYAGINYGGGAGMASQSDVLFDRGKFDVGGGVFGGTVGYNWQRAGVVYGLEGDLDYSTIKGATSGDGLTNPPCGVLSSVCDCSSKLRWLGTARARRRCLGPPAALRDGRRRGRLIGCLGRRFGFAACWLRHRHAGRLDGGWRHRSQNRQSLERQARISLCRSRQRRRLHRALRRRHRDGKRHLPDAYPAQRTELQVQLSRQSAGRAGVTPAFPACAR